MGEASSPGRPEEAPGRVIEVAAGLVFHGGRLLITQRYDKAHQGGLWEFPGGKREPEETFESCLRRELEEELGIQVAVGERIESLTHAYPGRTVLLNFFVCSLVSGEPAPIGCQDLRWVSCSQLDDFAFPAADARLLDMLRARPELWTAQVPLPTLSDEEMGTYQWQLDVTGFGVEGQRKLKEATVLISRCGGVGGSVALQLAAAGVGRLILAHGGNLKPGDLNRQTLMSAAALGTSRVECAARRLRELNPRIEVIPVPENISDANAERLAGQADLLVSCAPLFEERFRMNRAAVGVGRPLVECAMYEMELQVMSVKPGKTGCLACQYPEAPPYWTRKFPVFGAVSAVAGSIGAMEAIKILAGFGEPLWDRRLVGDLRAVSFRTFKRHRNPHCPVCGGL